LLAGRYRPACRARVDLGGVGVLASRKTRDPMRIRLIIIVTAALVLAYAGLIEPNWLKVRTYDLVIPGLASEVTLVHIADIHTQKLGPRESRALEAIERINPDFVLVAGDLVKGEDSIAEGLKFLSRIKARQAIYVVPGNGDHVLIEAIEAGEVPRSFGAWRVLMNESVDCGPFILVGIDDPVRCRDDIDRAFAGVGTAPGKPVFVLTHFLARRHLDDMRDRGVDMVFSGHTHGGQVGLGPLVSRIPYAHRSRYIAGLYALNTGYLYVTRGVGTNLFPLRLACRPEITVFHLKGA
jgi:predicted MPP superfamily phosphohydrolase